MAPFFILMIANSVSGSLLTSLKQSVVVETKVQGT